MKKVICIDSRNYGNPYFGGPRPNEGDVVTVTWEGVAFGILYYQLAGYPEGNGYAAWRFATLPDEPAEVIEEQEPETITA